MTGFTYKIPDLNIIDGQVNKFNVVFSDGEESYESEFQVYANIELPMVIDIQISSLISLLNTLKEQYGSIYDEYGSLNILKNEEDE